MAETPCEIKTCKHGYAEGSYFTCRMQLLFKAFHGQGIDSEILIISTYLLSNS